MKCLMNILTCYHTIHANGLTEMLKSGPVDGMEEQYYWDFVDNTYIDEVIRTCPSISGHLS